MIQDLGPVYQKQNHRFRRIDGFDPRLGESVPVTWIFFFRQVRHDLTLGGGSCAFSDRDEAQTHDGLTHDGLTVTENQVVRSVSIFVEPLVIIGLVAPCFFCLIGKFTGRRSRAKVRPRSTPQGTRVGKERQKDQTKKGDNKRDKKRDEKRDGKRESTRGGNAR